MLKFNTDSPHVIIVMIYKFNRTLLFGIAFRFEYLVVASKNCKT